VERAKRKKTLWKMTDLSKLCFEVKYESGVLIVPMFDNAD